MNADLAPNSSYATIEVKELLRLESLARLANMEHVSITSDAVGCALEIVMCGAVYWERGKLTRQSDERDSIVRISGSVASDSAVIGAILRGHSAMRLNSAELGPGALPYFGPGCELEGVLSTGFEHVGVRVPWGRLKAYLEQCEQVDSEPFRSGFGALYHPNFSGHAELLWESLRETAGDEEASDAALEELLGALFRANQAERSSLLRGNERRKLVLLAEEYMRENLDRPITVQILCHVTGASRRTLEYAFAEVIGAAPKEYLKKLRLTCARRKLLNKRGDWGFVKAAALECGFRHLGRFASDYRELFGEFPSETASLRGRSNDAGLPECEGLKDLRIRDTDPA